MRKLSILLVFAVLSLVSTTTFAQDAKEEVQAAVAQEQEKVEVQISELPEAVTKTLGEQFAEYTAEKAYKTVKGDKEVYYVKLVKGEEYKKVLIDAEGNLMEKEEKVEESEK